MTTYAFENLNRHGRRREKVFGDGRPRPLSRNVKLRIMALARALMRATEPGRHYGAITAKQLAVLSALLWGFHNAISGRCFPSYEAIAEKAGCSRSTVGEAIKALEDAEILTWVHRIRRQYEHVVDMFGEGVHGQRSRVLRTSNGYQFTEPPDVRSSKSELPSGTEGQNLFFLWQRSYQLQSRSIPVSKQCCRGWEVRFGVALPRHALIPSIRSGATAPQLGNGRGWIERSAGADSSPVGALVSRSRSETSVRIGLRRRRTAAAILHARLRTPGSAAPRSPPSPVGNCGFQKIGSGSVNAWLKVSTKARRIGAAASPMPARLTPPVETLWIVGLFPAAACRLKRTFIATGGLWIRRGATRPLVEKAGRPPATLRGIKCAAVKFMQNSGGSFLAEIEGRGPGVSGKWQAEPGPRHGAECRRSILRPCSRVSVQ